MENPPDFTNSPLFVFVNHFVACGDVVDWKMTGISVGVGLELLIFLIV